MNPDAIFTAIYEQTKRKVHAFLTAKCADCEDVEDLFQETYTELYRLLRRRGSDYIREPEALVISLAKQRLSRHYRRSARRREHELEPVESEDGSVLEQADIESLSVEEIVCDRLELERIRELLRSCGVEAERVIRLYFTEELTIAEIASLTKTSESNVKNRLYRTLKRLSAELKENEK